MTDCDIAGVTKALAGASCQNEESGVSFPQIFAQSYFQKYGDHSEALALIAAKNHANAVHNLLAHIQKGLGFEACNTIGDKNPVIAAPLRMTDCSLISDGAAALIRVADDIADSFANNIRFKAAVHVNDYLPMSRRDVRAFEGPALAFARAYAQAGVQVGDINFAKAHVCFTIAELLIYEAMQVAKPDLGLVFNMGGSGVANYCSILENGGR